MTMQQFVKNCIFGQGSFGSWSKYTDISTKTVCWNDGHPKGMQAEEERLPVPEAFVHQHRRFGEEKEWKTVGDQWEYLLEAGYTEQEIEVQMEGLSDGLVEMLTDANLTSSYAENIRFLTAYFDRLDILDLLVRYTGAFMMSNETFVQRIQQIAERLGDDWAQIVWEQYIEDDADALFEAVGFLVQSDWDSALERYTGSL